MEIIKAHDTNAISEGRNSADRKLFEGPMHKLFRSKNGKLELVDQVINLHVYVWTGL